MSETAAPPTEAPELDINNCPNCGEAWVKSPGYSKCWKCGKTPPSTMLATTRESDDRGDEPVDIDRATERAIADGHLMSQFQFVNKAVAERVCYEA
jgi:hypothetical protein